MVLVRSMRKSGPSVVGPSVRTHPYPRASACSTEVTREKTKNEENHRQVLLISSMIVCLSFLIENRKEDDEMFFMQIISTRARLHIESAMLQSLKVDYKSFLLIKE